MFTCIVEFQMLGQPMPLFSSLQDYVDSNNTIKSCAVRSEEGNRYLIERQTEI